ncbi:MAG: hypothetical protein LAQ30_10160, partial [Acidobacteriia bacterium]|nr:hypothetical protein [Terriglobia bacterium]
MRFILFLAALFPSFACAQTFSAHSGWNFQDTLQTATDILVGDASGAAVNTAGSFTQVRVQVRAVRVLSGNVSPGSELSVEWQCQPMPPLPDAGAALDGRALWFLRKREGGFEALAASSWGRFGGAFLPMPGGPLNPALAYTDSQPLPYKLAREIGFSMVEIATGQRAG